MNCGCQPTCLRGCIVDTVQETVDLAILQQSSNLCNVFGDGDTVIKLAESSSKAVASVRDVCETDPRHR